MARKKLERRVKKVIIHIGNSGEVFHFNSREKIDLSKEEKKHKIEKIKKEINKICFKTHEEQMSNQIKLNFSKSDSIIKAEKLNSLEQTNLILIQKQSEKYSNNENNDEINKSNNTQTSFHFDENNNDDEEFDSYLYDFYQ